MCSPTDYLQFHKHTLAMPERVVKRIKTGETFREEVPSNPTIELSPCSTPEEIDRPLPASMEEAHEYENAVNCYLEAECESDYDDRVTKTEKAIEGFSKIANLHNGYSQKAEYFQALCQIELAENAIIPKDQWSGLETSLTLFKKIKNPLHPCFARAQYWEGYCRYRLLAKTDPRLIQTALQRALGCFENVRNRSHAYFQDAQYWQGYCRFRLGKLAQGQRDKMVNFDQAKRNLLNVTDKENSYYVQAQLLAQQCAFEISQVSFMGT